MDSGSGKEPVVQVEQVEQTALQEVKKKKVKPAAWQERIMRLLGLQPGSRAAYSAVAGTSKHGRAKMRPRNWEAKRKSRRKMADKSRKRNRR